MTETSNAGPGSPASSSDYLPRPYASSDDNDLVTTAQTTPEMTDAERRRQIVAERMDNLADTPGLSR